MMNRPDLPATRDIVLVGGGHTHALILRRWGMRPLAGARLTLINPGPTAAYSGMLPGHIAGHYARDQLDIDLVKLARFAGARVILGAANGLDRDAREVHVPSRPPVGFDLCSIDIGITSAMPDLPGFRQHAVPAKPLGPFATAWQHFLSGEGPANVAVIGAGVAGAELSLAMAHALRRAERPFNLTLLERESALTGLNASGRRQLLESLGNAGIHLREHVEITKVAQDHITLANADTIPAEFVTGAAAARPAPWLSECGLATEAGFLRVNPTLQTSDQAIFAVGDCAHLSHAPRPKAGVYAVRQAPVLFDNLRAACTGARMRSYRPQGDYLKLVSLGGKSAIGSRFGLTSSGPLMWRWKDRIDQKFMDKFRTLPAMTPPPLPRDRTSDLAATLGPKPMCGGCGAKVGRAALAAQIGRPERPGRSDVELLPGDDAALLRTGGVRQVLTTDHLRAFVDDPVVMTRIAAIHALGDIWAMGAAPQAATANLILPRLAPPLQERTLREIMEAARDVMTQAGAEIVGGHTSVGAELTIGFSITGLCDSAPITLGGARPGDALILTKPIGTGVIMAAEMSGEAEGGWVATALTHMQQPQTGAARVLAGAHAMTDVTGFGLIGHLTGMCEASGTSAVIDPGQIPYLAGAETLAALGIRSTLFPENRRIAPWITESPRNDLLFDPQTAGGLLAAVSADRADALCAALIDAGYPAARIGHLEAGPPYVTLA
nr:selenide, water dikinase SelD [Poseidonocella pacifica]